MGWRYKGVEVWRKNTRKILLWPPRYGESLDRCRRQRASGWLECRPMIITRYLTRQILQTTLALSFILLVVAVLGRLLKYLAQASQGELDPGVLFLLMSYRMPDFLQLILPIALLLGILLAYGRLYAESEMTVLVACGVGSKRLLHITLLSAGLVAAATALLTLYLTPRGMVSASNLLESQKNLSEFDVMVPGLFQDISRGARTTYAERIDAAGMHEVFMHESAGNRVIVAETALPIEGTDGERFILFRNGSITEGVSGDAGYTLTRFGELGVRLPPRQISFEASLEEQAMGNRALLASSDPAHAAELQWRLSLVMLIPILTLLAVPLSKVSPRQGRFARLVPAILLYIAYFGLLLVSRDQLARGVWPPWLGLWWVHVLFAGLGWALFTERLSADAIDRWRHGKA
jgi:lipopolysaccharide export system permease protein